MSIWGTIVGGGVGLAVGGPLGALVGAALGGAVDLAGRERASPRRRQAAFTIAAVALSAKMARADGEATAAEFAAFERLFHVERTERAHVARFYRLAQQSPHGFEVYAAQARDLLGEDNPALEDLAEALLMIASADHLGGDDLDYVDRVRTIFGISDTEYARLKRRYVTDDPEDSYTVLGIDPGASREEIRAAYRTLALRHHPDRHYAEGTPAEFIRVSEHRMAEINAAYRELAPR